MGSRTNLAQQVLYLLDGQIRILLGAGEDEFLVNDGLVQHKPGVTVSCASNVRQTLEVVATGDDGVRQTLTLSVEPHGGRARDDANTVGRPDGIPVLHTLRVVPHAVSVRQARTGLLRNLNHAAIHVCWHALHHVLRCWPPAILRPGAAHQIQVSADAS